jgi:hypothetical protein
MAWDRLALQKLVEQTGVDVWEQWGYQFYFAEQKYYWKGKPITIGPRAARMLYERLVLGRCAGVVSSPGSLGQLRGKYGPDFLAEVINRRKVHPGRQGPKGWLWR